MDKRFAGTFFLACMTACSLSALADEQAVDRPVNAEQDALSNGPQEGGKGPGMGRDYQKNTPGPGQGEPDYRGGKTNTDSIEQVAPETTPKANKTDAGQGNSGAEGKGKGKGPDAGGQGVGYPGYRGQGGEGSPHHRQYGSPPRGSSNAEENTTATSN